VYLSIRAVSSLYAFAQARMRKPGGRPGFQYRATHSLTAR
jgi:hypothetical protein